MNNNESQYKIMLSTIPFLVECVYNAKTEVAINVFLSEMHIMMF